MTKLKPCPFCGGKAERRDNLAVMPTIDSNGADIGVEGVGGGYWIECTECGASTKWFDPGRDAADVDDAWNQRVGAADPLHRSKAEEAAMEDLT